MHSAFFFFALSLKVSCDGIELLKQEEEDGESAAIYSELPTNLIVKCNTLFKSIKVSKSEPMSFQINGNYLEYNEEDFIPSSLSY